MKHYINTQDGKLIDLLDSHTDVPSHYALLSDAEFALLSQQVVPAKTVLDELCILDTQNNLSQRNLRDALIALNEVVKTLGADLSSHPAIAKAYSIEAQASVLRSKL